MNQGWVCLHMLGCRSRDLLRLCRLTSLMTDHPIIALQRAPCYNRYVDPAVLAFIWSCSPGLRVQVPHERAYRDTAVVLLYQAVVRLPPLRVSPSLCTSHFQCVHHTRASAPVTMARTAYCSLHAEQRADISYQYCFSREAPVAMYH